MAGLSSLTTTAQVVVTWNAQLNLTGSAYNPLSNAGRITKQQNNGTAIANATLGGADEFISFVQSITGGGNATLDLTAITNILQQSGTTLARVKVIIVQLLSIVDDSVNGSNCKSISVGGTTTNPFNLNNTGGTITTTNTSGTAVLTFSPAAPQNGTLITIAGATGNTNINGTFNTFGASGATASIATLNSTGGSSVITSNAALTNTPTWTQAASRQVYNGGVSCYFDAPPNTASTVNQGLLVSATAKNLFILNNDPSVAAKVQITIIGGTS